MKRKSTDVTDFYRNLFALRHYALIETTLTPEDREIWGKLDKSFSANANLVLETRDADLMDALTRFPNIRRVSNV